MNEDANARRFDRERRARKEAERLLESKSRELYEANRELTALTQSLEQQVAERTRDLANTRDEALAASSAKSRFIAVMSHEIRSPLNGVIGALGLLRDTELDGEQLRYVEIARGSAASLLDIVNEVLDYSKIEADKLDLEPTPVDVRDLIEGVTDSFQMRCREKSIALVSDVDESVPGNLLGDGARIRQVLVNLVDNALKFTNKGEIRIAAEMDTLSAADGTWVNFSVRDTGVGILEENKARLFDEFWSWDAETPARISGTGLGLAISNRLVALMGGKMGVDSEPGAGSTFWFRIPLASIENSAVGRAEGIEQNAPEVPQKLSGRVLLAEDNTSNQMIAKAMLNKSGLTVDVAGNGLEALEAIRSRPYDVVLMDIDMPEMDGLEATRSIRALPGAGSRTPIVAMTAHAMRGDRERFLAEGLDDYIVKPISRAELAQCLSRWLESNRTGNTPISDRGEGAGVSDQPIRG